MRCPLMRPPRPDEILNLPPSQLTRDDWVRLYGEEFADWMRLTPEERWRESMRLWATFYALGGRLDDDAEPPPLRRLGV